MKNDGEDWTLPEEREAQVFWQKFKSQNKTFDLKKLFTDYLDGKVTSAFFVLMICWTWSGTKVEQNGISYLSWWAIWSSCENFIYDDRDLPLDDLEWNDEADLRERVKLALDGNYREIWRRVGLSEKAINEMENL